MSKRKRAEFDTTFEGEEQARVVDLEAKLADTERRLVVLSSFGVDKIREPSRHHTMDKLFQSYVDPLANFELMKLRSDYDKLLLRSKEMQKEIVRFSGPSAIGSAAIGTVTGDERKRSQAEVLEARKQISRLESEAQDMTAFVEYLKSQVKDYKSKNDYLSHENVLLKAELQRLQQHQQQYSMQQEDQSNMQSTHSAGWDFSSALPEIKEVIETK